MLKIGVKYEKATYNHLELWRTLAQHCGWWWPYEHLVIIADRPKTFTIDANRRLHNETGPAMLFRDGYALWAWHGVRVPRHVIESPEHLTLQHIRDENNKEIQRIMIERFGWDQFMHEAEARQIDVDTEPAGAPGLRALMQLWDGEKVLVVCCASTGRTYYLEVPSEIQTCQHAAAWLAHEDDLTLLVRT